MFELLQPDEEVFETFPALDAAMVDEDSPIPLAQRGVDRTVVSTSERILVLAGGQDQPTGALLAEQPRSVRITRHTPTVSNGLAAAGRYQMQIGTQSLLVRHRHGQTLPWADLVPRGDAPQPADHAAHAAGRICKVCGKPIRDGEAARRRGESQWAHDVCPVI